MKRIAYLFLLLSLASCGTLRPSEQNRITIQFRDAGIEEYYALGVRANSFVVAPYQIGPVSLRDVLATASVVPFENIEKVYCKGNRTFGNFLYHTFGGGFTGSLIGFLTFVWLNDKLTAPEDKGKAFIDGTPYAIGIGFACGMIVGTYLYHLDQELSPVNLGDIMSLREHNALYHDLDPPELQNIK